MNIIIGQNEIRRGYVSANSFPRNRRSKFLATAISPVQQGAMIRYILRKAFLINLVTLSLFPLLNSKAILGMSTVDNAVARTSGIFAIFSFSV